MERSARAELSQDAGLQALAARQSVGWKSRIGRPVNGSPLPDFRPDFRDAAAVVPVSADAAGVLNSPPQRSTEGAVTGKPAVRWPLRAGGRLDRESTRLDSNDLVSSYAVFCFDKK